LPIAADPPRCRAFVLDGDRAAVPALPDIPTRQRSTVAAIPLEALVLTIARPSPERKSG
jgi:hypothetical protein